MSRFFRAWPSFSPCSLSTFSVTACATRSIRRSIAGECAPRPSGRLRSGVARGAGDRRSERLLRASDLDAVGQGHAILGRDDLGKDGDRNLRRRAAADIEADGSVQPLDLLRQQGELLPPLSSLRLICTGAERAAIKQRG